MKEYANRINAKNVVFTGNTNPKDYYRKACVFCHTSFLEVFGLVLVEAMNWGCVPMAFDSFPACQDIIPDDCGYRVKPFDKDEYGFDGR